MQESIDHWRALAAEQRRRPSWDPHALASICNARADTYERAARALEMERETGQWHCACCLKPQSGARHA